MIIPVSKVGQHGIITDLPFTELPLNVWTAGRNVRFRDAGVEKFTGHVEVFPGAVVAPQWLQTLSTIGADLWLYAGEAGVGATDGTSHANITRASGPYSFSKTIGWTGTIIEGIPVINNGLDVPQMWRMPALSQVLEDLEAWPVGVTARALRGLKRYLVALDVTKDGVRYSNMIKWSHQAPTGNVPVDWDTSDETTDAGEYVLPSEGGDLVDGLRLRDSLVLYKESEIWLMDFIGTASGVFRFTRKFGQVGCFARRCAVEYLSGRHFVFTGDDALVHDGQTINSVMTEKVKKLIEERIDADNASRAFVAVNFPLSEVWTCVPRRGQPYPNEALVWNWKNGLWGLRDIPHLAYIESGRVPPPTEGEVWDGAIGVWDTDSAVWGERTPQPAKPQMVFAAPEATKLYVGGQGLQFAGESFTSFVERSGIGFPTKHEGPPDYTRFKQVLTLWPVIEGTVGGIVNVHLGTQAKINGPINYTQVRPFVIGETEALDFSDSDSARLHALKFESNSAVHWRLSSYDVEVIDRGMHG